MAATVAAFNALYGHKLSETEGWQFLVLLKMARGRQGDYHSDDYSDQTGYSALAGESAYRAAFEVNPSPIQPDLGEKPVI